MLDLRIDTFKVILRKATGTFYKTACISENAIITKIVNNLYFCDSNLYKEWMTNLFLL